MNNPFPEATIGPRPPVSGSSGGKIGKLDVLQGCCLGVSKEVERWPE